VVEMRGKLLALRGEAGGAGGVDDEEYKIKVAKDKYNLASDLDDRGDYDEAFALYDEALELYTEVRGHDSKDVADTLVCTAIVYRKQGKDDEALDLYQKAEKVYVAVYGHTPGRGQE
jgi:tetratricopeptide (TPR) repeat protein